MGQSTREEEVIPRKNSRYLHSDPLELVAEFQAMQA